MRDKNIFYIMIGIALVLVISVGYALFSETIQIKGTAKAEGSFNITADCHSGLPENDTPLTGYNQLIGPLGSTLSADNGYANDSCTPDNQNNIVSFQTDLKYPGAVRNFTVKFTNTGTIDAVLVGDGENPGITAPVMQRCTGENYQTCVASDETNIGFDVRAYSKSGNNNNTIIYTLNDNYQSWQDFIDLENGRLVLKPGESMYVVYEAEWDESDVPEGGSGTVDYRDKFQMSYRFDQKVD